MANRFIRNAVAAAAMLAGATALAHAQQPLKIGFMNTFTGAVGVPGEQQYNGFMLAIEERGGKLGGVPVQIIKEDDQFKPELATQIVQKLIERDQVPIIAGITGSNVMMAVAKPITDKGVFLISTNSGPSPLAGAACSPNFFSTSWQNDNIAEVVGQYATDKGYKKVVLITANFQGGKDLLEGFKRFYTGEVVDEIYTPLTQLDFSSELTQVASQNPDAVYAFFPGGLGVSFVRQYQLAGLLKATPLLSSGILELPMLEALKDSALGAFGGHFWGPDMDNEANKKFVKDYEEKYGTIPSTWAAQGYDGALLLDSAIAKVNGNVADKDAFRAALKEADFDSVRGDFSFNTNHFPIQDFSMYEVVKDEKGRYTVRTEATPMKAHKDAYYQDCPLN
ncbi:ABC transporter substrate-binding protein [Pusillimonas sp.]|uniref:ABC transporter substrate-binding protein n=1 Tax=Pusillimonas sp. TaxID=3040095 RepID=UPI0037CB5E2A